MTNPLHTIDRALWRLPRPARRALVAPVLVVAGTVEALRDGVAEGAAAGRDAFADVWHHGIDHVDHPPSRDAN